MDIPQKKTIEEHCDYVCELARLSFFYAFALYRKGEGIVEAISNHTPLLYHALELAKEKDLACCFPAVEMRGIDIHDRVRLAKQRPEWVELMAQAERIAEVSPDAAHFEEAMFAEVRDFAISQARHLYPESVGIAVPKSWNAGSLKYDPPTAGRPGNICNFHIANAVAPQSIFTERAYLPECFLLLMERSEAEYGFDTLATGTWLNDTPRFLALFPDEWRRNLSSRNSGISWHFGNWGQLVTARGTFNHRAGEHLRKFGEMRYASRSSQCSFASMRRHLEWFLAQD